MKLETIQCDICGRDYTIDNDLFSPYGTEYITIRLENFISSSVQTKRYNTCPECTRKIFDYIIERRIECLKKQ